ncbi:hypothetical protein HRbin23_00031 [bacterium HR23]|nr:hypothetical protein HRbin23_00031 [bacterium HR23]
MKRSLLVLAVLALLGLAFLAGSLWGGRAVSTAWASRLRQPAGHEACVQMMQGHEQCLAMMGSHSMMDGMHGRMMGF